MKKLHKAVAKIFYWCWDALAVSEFGMGLTQRLKYLAKVMLEAEHRHKLRCCGDSVNFQFPLYFTAPERIELGDNVAFAAFVHIWGDGGVTIGNRVMIGSHTAITSVTHDYLREVMYGASETRPVVIGNDVWVGSHVTIMPGITIENGAVIGAGAVVTHDVPARAIVAGVPARVVKYRDPS